jgi:transcriptional regulator of aromatic amino acid metabolism
VTNLYASDFPWCLETLLPHGVNLRGNRSNLLVNCSFHELHTVANELARLCARPVQMCSMPGWLDLPLNFSGTLVLARIEELTLDQQIGLFDWLTMVNGTTQVVSVATMRLDQLVKAGRFLEGLFYRLNVVQIDVRSWANGRAISRQFPEGSISRGGHSPLPAQIDRPRYES